MRFGKLYTLLVLSFSLQVEASPQMREMPNFGSRSLESNIIESSGDPIRDFFETQLLTLDSGIKKQTDPRQKILMVKQSLEQIRSYRSEREMGDTDNEVYMDIVVHALEEVPGPQRFHREQCGMYRQRILRNYEPTASESNKPQDPAVRQALVILEKVCA